MIKCINIKKNFGNVKAVKGISFELEKGTFLGLIGANGAGKTTLIRTMIGLLDPSEGEVYFNNKLMKKDAIDIKKRLGVVSQHINLDKELTVEENLYFSGRLYEMNKKDIVRESNKLLSMMDLLKVKNRVSKKLSGGMKRKLMIAKSLIHNPDYIFLDEPTVGIDVNSRKEIWKVLKKYQQLGKTIILTTHYIEEVEELCDNVMLINEGEIFRRGTSEELINEVGSYKVEYIENNKINMNFFKNLNEAKESIIDLKFDFKISETSLEDIFFHYTRKKVKSWE